MGNRECGRLKGNPCGPLRLNTINVTMPARDVFYGNRGRINARDLWEQMNSCSCLTLIVACIIYWQARDMSRVIRTADPERHGIELSLLRHVSPIEWDNIVLYGEYVLNRRLVRRSRSRP